VTGNRRGGHRDVVQRALHRKPDQGKKINWPRLINDQVIMTIGSTRPLIDALLLACSDMVNWLVADYGFDKLEALQLLGQAAELEIANVVDPQYSVACILDKKYLPSETDGG
jgi:acetamidase/formamidase